MQMAWGAAGFSINGEAKDTELMRKSGLKAGQALVLTKPLGSGVLFAADMRGKAKGSWVSGAQQRCVVSNVPPARRLEVMVTCVSLALIWQQHTLEPYQALPQSNVCAGTELCYPLQRHCGTCSRAALQLSHASERQVQPVAAT